MKGSAALGRPGGGGAVGREACWDCRLHAAAAWAATSTRSARGGATRVTIRSKRSSPPRSDRPRHRRAAVRRRCPLDDAVRAARRQTRRAAGSTTAPRRARTTPAPGRRGGRCPSGRPSARGSASPSPRLAPGRGPGPGSRTSMCSAPCRVDHRAQLDAVVAPSSPCSMLLVTSSETMSLTSPVAPAPSGSASTARRARTMLAASRRQQMRGLVVGHVAACNDARATDLAVGT